jgi:hypothetical protein
MAKSYYEAKYNFRLAAAHELPDAEVFASDSAQS